jgi:hypothetical protein
MSFPTFNTRLCINSQCPAGATASTKLVTSCMQLRNNLMIRTVDGFEQLRQIYNGRNSGPSAEP